MGFRSTSAHRILRKTGSGRSFGVAVLLIASVAMSACRGDDPDLAKLKEDPMATYSALGVTLERRSEAKGGTSLGKEVRARILQRFRLADGATASDAHRAAIRSAQNAGWTFPDPAAKVAAGNKNVAGMQSLISIYLSEDVAPALLIVLEALKDPAAR
jgi:hypothetical protein